MDFAELVEIESRGLTAAVFSILGDWRQAEDVVQDSFERCFARWHRVSRLDRPGAWVRRVAINAAISQRRRRSSERRALARLSDASAVGASEVGSSVEGSDLWNAVRALPTEQAAAIALRYAADLSIAEIAVTMKVSESAVKSLLHRGRATLRETRTVQAYAPNHGRTPQTIQEPPRSGGVR